MNKTIKIMSTIIIVMILCFACTPVFAGGQTGTTSGGTDLSTFIPDPDYTGDGADEIQTLGGKIAGYVQIAGISIAVVILIYIGIKYILGSAEDQANYKKSMMPYLVGAIILFAASFIVGIIANVGQSIGQG